MPQAKPPNWRPPAPHSWREQGAAHDRVYHASSHVLQRAISRCSPQGTRSGTHLAFVSLSCFRALGMASRARSPMGAKSLPRKDSGSPVGSLPRLPSRSARSTKFEFCKGAGQPSQQFRTAALLPLGAATEQARQQSSAVTASRTAWYSYSRLRNTSSAMTDAHCAPGRPGLVQRSP